MTFSHVNTFLDGHFAGVASGEPVRYLSLDSRKSFPGQGAVFFCITGIQHNGHDYATEAYLKGWRHFVVEQIPFSLEEFPEASLFVVKNSLLALQKFGEEHRKQFSYPVIAITGSNGKTIVKEWLYQLTASSYSVIKSPKSYNSQVGVPLSVWNMSQLHNLAIFEAGISEPGEMHRLESIIKPDIGIITNIGSAHDASFQSLSQKLKEKLRLFTHCKKLIYCTDHELIRQELIQNPLEGVELIGWGKSNARYAIQTKGEMLVVVSPSAALELTLPFSDPKSIENLSHCVVAALEAGISPEEIPGALQTFKAVPMRMVLRAGVHGSLLIDDSYNNDVQGLDAALDFSVAHSHGKKLTVVLSDILQSKGNADQLYAGVDQLLVSKGVSRFVGIGPALSGRSHLFRTRAEFYPDTDSFLARVEPADFAGEAILIKGARYFGFEKVVKRLQAKLHRTVLEINLEALQHNFNYFRSLTSPPAKSMVMLKAFAYGSGSGEIGRTLQYLKADYIAVAFPDEGVILRQQGVQIPIMVLNAPTESYDVLSDSFLEPEIYSFEQLEDLRSWTKATGKTLHVHLKLDTGMHRLGFLATEWQALKEAVREMPKIVVKSIFSHLAVSENPDFDTFTHEQVLEFSRGYDLLTAHLSEKPLKHILNSAGIARFPAYHFDMVRIGIGLHGIEATKEDAGRLRPVACLKTVVSQVKFVDAGQTIGYGRTGKIDKPTRIATIAVGYADGYGRSFGNGKGKVLINGKLFPTIGSICMDMTMVDVRENEVTEGDEVIVFGEHPTVSQLAGWAGTIPYEILTSVSERVRRVYLSE